MARAEREEEGEEASGSESEEEAPMVDIFVGAMKGKSQSKEKLSDF